jgi:transketolase
MQNNIELGNMRQAYADTVIELAENEPRIIFVSADCGSHERDYFQAEGSGRLIEVGIAEANSAVIAAGMAAEGYKPYLLNFAYLLGRMYNQISQSIAQDAYDVTIGAYYAGVWGTGGRSHNCVTDLAMMRALPNFSIFAPADFWETKAIIRVANSLSSPVYVRLSGIPTPVVFDSEPICLPVRRMIDGDNCTIFCHGTMVHEALMANDVGNLNASVVNVSQIKPLPAQEIISEAKRTGCIMIVEEHSVVGGLGEAISTLIANNCPMPVKTLAVPDMYPFSVLREERNVYKYYGISYEDIIRAGNNLMKSAPS